MKVKIKNKNSTYNKQLKEAKKSLDKANEYIMDLEAEERGTLLELVEDFKTNGKSLSLNIKQILADIKFFNTLIANMNFNTVGLSFALRTHTGAHKQSRIAFKPVIEAAKDVIIKWKPKKVSKKKKK